MARSTFKVLFYVNGSKERNGIVPIMGRVTINGTVAQFSCKQSVPKTLWDIKGNRAKGNSKEARGINLALDNIKAQIIKHYQRIEKLIPTIKFLRETLYLGDAAIRILCTFKDVSIRGELYSREFN